MKVLGTYIKILLKNLEGNLLLIGNYSKVTLDIIDKNTKITNCDQLTNNLTSTSSGKKEKGKKLSIKKLKKYYKKNYFNTAIVNVSQIKDYKNTFVRDSIYVVKDKIYLMGNDERIVEMYKRYSNNIEIIECINGNIISIDVTNAKNKFLKDKWYQIKDFLYDLTNVISDIL